jgi:hypothetical protein
MIELLDRCIIDPCMPRPRVLDWYQIDRKGGRPASMQATSSADEWSPSPSRIGGVSLARSGVLQRCPLYAWVHASSIRACLPACLPAACTMLTRLALRASYHHCVHICNLCRPAGAPWLSSMHAFMCELFMHDRMNMHV